MLCLLLLFTNSVLGASSVTINQESINDFLVSDRNTVINIDNILDLTNSNIDYIVIIEQTLEDIAAKTDPLSQALAVSQVSMITLEIASFPGVASFGAASTTLIDAYVTGNYRSSLVNFIKNIANNLDILVKLANNAQTAAVTQKSNSSGIGRNYQFEAAWDAIKKANPSIAILINKEYEAVKELYNSKDDQLNQVGAVITASALPPVAMVFLRSLKQMVNLINVLGINENSAEAVDAAKKALLESVSL